MRSWFIHAFGIVLVSGMACAQNGKVLYETYCGACHSPDGKGINNGQFPPLSGSPWIQGKPDRMIQAILHGLQGPIAVGDKEYNLVMPPQGGTLTDDQLSKVVSYVRDVWGGKGSAVSVEDIKAQRAVSKNRSEMWASSELLKLYPLASGGASGKSPIKNLIAHVYHGTYTSVADLVKAKPAAVEEEQDGVLRIDNVGRTDNFGIVWEGDLEVPQDGKYTFQLDSDDGSAVYLDGKSVVTLDRAGGIGQPAKGSVQLKKGTHKFRAAYFETTGDEGFRLAWSGPGLKGLNWLTANPEAKRGKPSEGPRIPIVAPAGEATIYRNFIEGTTPRAIAVGYHAGVNLAFSADNMAMELIWLGKFMDGGRHWTDRGQGNEKPAGHKLLKLSKGPAFAVLEGATTPWPTDYQEGLEPTFRGYMFNKKQEPTFYYNLGSLEVSDRPEPGATQNELRRTLTISSTSGSPKTVVLRVAVDWPIQDLGSQRFDIGGQATVKISGGGKALVREGKELLLSVPLKKGETTITLTYIWN
jgi:cytochrome c553